MSAAVVIKPASGSITHLKDACEVSATGVASNTATGYDSTKYPSEPAVVAFFKLSATGQPTLKSQLATASSAGDIYWPGSIIFPAAATWTLDLVNNADGTTVLATASVVVA